MWQYSPGYGEARHVGWLWVQGCWTWGLVLTWRVVESQEPGPKYWWLGELWTYEEDYPECGDWKWDKDNWKVEEMCWYFAFDTIEPWMVAPKPWYDIKVIPNTRKRRLS